MGYRTLITDGTRSPLIGLSFVPVNGGNAKLGDFKPVDGTMSAADDMLQVIDPTSLDATALYVYCDKTTADAIAEEEGEEPGTFDFMIGWWDGFGDVGEEESARNNVKVTAGYGFMGLFESGNEIQFQSAGKASTEPTSVTTDGSRSPIIVNYIPKPLKLGQIVPVDGTMSAADDMLQVIDPTSLDATALYVYCDKTTADAIAEEEGEEPGTFDFMIGWWDGFGDVGEEESARNNVDVPAGYGFMGLFESGNEIQFQFPSSLAETPKYDAE